MHPIFALILRSIAVTTLSVMLVSAASAQQTEPTKPRPRPQAQTQTQPLKPSPRRQPTACSEFGAGFVRMPGSSTCIQFGGGVDVGAGVGPGR